MLAGAASFWDPFWQIYAIAMTEGLFDRFFIDWYWVGHTKTLIVKWEITIIGNPLIAAALAGILLLFF